MGFPTNGLVKFIEHRIADRRGRATYPEMDLRAGVAGGWEANTSGKSGTPPRAEVLRRFWRTSILHYVFDLWVPGVASEVRHHGDVIVRAIRRRHRGWIQGQRRMPISSRAELNRTN